ncbi:MAG: hypothetical protein R3B94_15105 [Hyphomonas sp.]
MGVNGSGKTTTIGKIASKLKEQGPRPSRGGRYVPRCRYRAADRVGRTGRNPGHVEADRRRCGWPCL